MSNNICGATSSILGGFGHNITRTTNSKLCHNITRTTNSKLFNRNWRSAVVILGRMDVKSELLHVVGCGYIIIVEIGTICKELNSSIIWSLSIIVLGIYDGDGIRDVLVFYWWID